VQSGSVCNILQFFFLNLRGVFFFAIIM